jgi:hypothetical protein
VAKFQLPSRIAERRFRSHAARIFFASGRSSVGLVIVVSEPTPSAADL